jgi:alkylation response protein AidB-like acyl-CoA dehydrogenase
MEGAVEAGLAEQVARYVDEVVAPVAVATDRDGAFPVAALDAFRASGLGGLTGAPECGGAGRPARDAAHVVERIARHCGSTAMIVAMHYSAVAVIEAFAEPGVRADIAQGRLLATLAFSEAGSRSQFWAPTSAARRDGDTVLLDARKSWVTSASNADLFVWSSRPLEAEGMSTLWLVPRETAGIAVAAPFDGLGLRGNDSAPVTAEGARIPASAMLGADGKGADVMLGTVLPVFALLNSACAVGLMTGAIERTIGHVTATRFAHDGSGLHDLPTIRAYLARMQVRKEQARALLDDALAGLERPSETTMLRVLAAKAAAGEAATETMDLAMRVCGGAAFRKEVGVERFFRDARAGTVMAPTTDQLYDFIGRALCGMDLFG